ncbi:MAG: enoyl-CoA hydratase/isomerase family protein [Acidobacteria bacterium]|nr:enoyl-CoA hydratase/isomerase family protein [Acidobacteriota bacterium]
MVQHERLHVDIVNRVATVTFDHAATRNSITSDMWTVIRDVFHGFASNPDVRVVVLTGAGDHFGSGADVSRMSDRGPGVSALDAMREVGSATQAIYELAKPTIARMRGTVAGASANLALACDLLIADDTMRFIEVFVRRGLTIDAGGSWLLPRQIGMARAKEMVLLGDAVDAGAAREMGLVNRVLSPADLDACVDELAGRLATGPAIAMGMSKRLLNQAYSVSLNEALEAESHAQVVNFQTPDASEAMRAFIEKRAPKFE